MPEFRTSPGFRDLLHPASTRQRAFVDAFASVVEAAGFELVVPPLLEDVGVFRRLGEATDVVTKEMYDFVDKGDRHVVLRPEQTAGVCRAFVEHRPAVPWKAWCFGPNFRYERPQRGRYRQFEQVDVEVLGTDDPQADIEVIALGWRFFASLGLSQVRLLVNSLGTREERLAHMESLRTYFEGRAGELSEQSRATLARNPLRVLDSKRAEDEAVIAAAPPVSESLGDESSAHFAAVLAGLDALGIPYDVDARLVRGLDYYVRTTFEYAGGTLESAQNALGGGGRYDGLVEDLGGPSTPGIGLALGVDRTLLACDDEGVFPAPVRAADVFVVDVTGGTNATSLTDELRQLGYRAERAYDRRSMRSQMKAADRSGAELAVIYAPDELADGSVVVRRLRDDGEQFTVPIDGLATKLAEHLDSLISNTGPKTR
ncbi:MAG: histidine--tRNA ligase [Actinomycetota bacterium]|nr:histidine--tRNA ligase [Actinomycetota bacterium]